ncbi:Hypothetical predicted protein [Mytilus galloprovincialis]|uniref:C2H2-type domain-containing protein n=1 Tax=Mytilus galloprovincialis TaxID=29158 RepID=A0A8B6BJR7_MYTGA|nr:Hypothetical predicted protein [Mytilus galloprovincialis]
MFACNGNLCTFKTTSKKIMKWHVIRHHMPLESVPFHCTLCQYRAKNFMQLNKHFDQQKHKLMNLQQNLSPEQCIGTSKPYELTFTHDKRGDVQILQAESIPEEIVVQTEESVSLSDVVTIEETTHITEDILQKAVKYAEIQEEEDFIPDYDDYSIDDTTVINKPKDNSCQTDEDLVQRVSLLEEQLKMERESHKIETNKLADFIERLQTRLEKKEEEVKNLNSMIVTIDEYENLPKYGTRSSHALDGFEELWNNPDDETVRLQQQFKDNNNNSTKRPVNQSPNPTKKRLKSVVIRPKSSVEVWKEFAHKVNKSYKKDLLPRKGYRF